MKLDTTDDGYAAFLAKLQQPMPAERRKIEALQEKARTGRLYDPEQVLRRYERQQAFRRRRS